MPFGIRTMCYFVKVTALTKSSLLKILFYSQHAGILIARMFCPVEMNVLSNVNT